MAKRKRKKRIRWDRVLIAFVVVGVFVFGIYKGTSFVIHQVMSWFNEDSSEAVEETLKTYKATVIIDAGHGGIDVGANVGDLYEKNITLKTSQYIQKELDKYNIKAILTRQEDQNLKDEKNADLIERASYSEKYNADYFVSIHVNGFKDSDAIYGFEVYTKDEESKSLANMILTQMDTLNYSKNRGLVDGKNLMILKKNTVPAVLIELGYIKSQDQSYLSDDDKLQNMAKAISKGILNKVDESLGE